MTVGALLLPSPLSLQVRANQEVQSEICQPSAAVSQTFASQIAVASQQRSAPRLSPVSALSQPMPVLSGQKTVFTEVDSAPKGRIESPTLSASSPRSSYHTPQPAPKPLQAVASLGDPEKATNSAPVALADTARPTPQTQQVQTLQIRVYADGQEQTKNVAVTPKLTVGQALAAMGISLAVLDRVMPETNALARNGMSVHIVRIRSHIEKQREFIPAEVRYQPTTKIRAGAKQVIVQPRAGYFETAQRVWTRDGKTTRREFMSRRLACMPQHKVIALGVRPALMPNMIRPNTRYRVPLTARGGSPRDRMMNQMGGAPQIAPADPNTFRAIKSLSVTATGYSAGRAGGAVSNWTATGVRCTYGAVAVDPHLIPLGTKMYIEGYGYAFACDTGGAIKGRHIDLAFDSPRAAFVHGRRRMTVWILAP